MLRDDFTKKMVGNINVVDDAFLLKLVAGSEGCWWCWAIDCVAGVPGAAVFEIWFRCWPIGSKAPLTARRWLKKPRHVRRGLFGGVPKNAPFRDHETSFTGHVPPM